MYNTGVIRYGEEEYLSLSGIQHFAYCRRQWALIHIEQQWDDNLRTVEGTLLHKKAHDRFATERRNGVLTVRGMSVSSYSLGFYGMCDVVEFVRDDENGVSIMGQTGKYRVIPVEYKRGRPKENDVDVLQLAAQAMCLEEMLCCDIPHGFLFYGETRRRLQVEIDEALHKRVKDIAAEMHMYFERRYTPRVRRTKSCNACSLKEICLPALGKNVSAKDYLERRLTAADEE